MYSVHCAMCISCLRFTTPAQSKICMIRAGTTRAVFAVCRTVQSGYPGQRRPSVRSMQQIQLGKIIQSYTFAFLEFFKPDQPAVQNCYNWRCLRLQQHGFLQYRFSINYELKNVRGLASFLVYFSSILFQHTFPAYFSSILFQHTFLVYFSSILFQHTFLAYFSSILFQHTFLAYFSSILFQHTFVAYFSSILFQHNFLAYFSSILFQYTFLAYFSSILFQHTFLAYFLAYFTSILFQHTFPAYFSRILFRRYMM